MAHRNIIAISRGKLTVSVIDVRSKKIIKSVESDWTMLNLGDVLAKAKTELEGEIVRVLIGDDLSYNLSATVPREMNGEKEREYLYKYIKEEIPEELADSDWDFKEIGLITTGKEKGKKQVIIFAPVKSLLKTLRETFAKLGVQIEAIEPQSAAVKRNKNPIIGLALKRDIKGNDEDVLNLSELKNDSVLLAGMPRRLVYIGFVLLFLITSSLVYVYRNNSQIGSTKEMNQEVLEDGQIYNYSVNIIYPSEVDPNEVEQLLKDGGFESVSKTEDGSSAIETTVVRSKSGVSEISINEVQNYLKDYETAVSTTPLGEDNEFDIEVNLGKKKSN